MENIKFGHRWIVTVALCWRSAALRSFLPISNSAVILVLMFGLTGCWGPEEVVRNIRVIAKAEVAGKVVEGSAVMSLRWRAGDRGRMYRASRSEAVILELDGRGTVYVLDGFMGRDAQDSYNSGYWHSQIDAAQGVKYAITLEDFPELRSAQGRFPVVIRKNNSPSTLPMLVMLGDETRMETLRRVLPEDFPKEFGEDVRFLGLWFEFTDDPPTEKIIKRLPISVKVNESYWTAFPTRDATGELIPAAKKPFPYKIGKSRFNKRTF